MSDQKTEKPTPKKLKDGRKDGMVSRSGDFVDAISMIASAIFILISAHKLSNTMHTIVMTAVTYAYSDHSLPNTISQLYKFTQLAMSAVFPCLAVATLSGLAASVTQVGFHISTKPVLPNFDSLNPATGIKRILSPKSTMELIKMIAKSIIVSAVMCKSIIWLLPIVAESTYEPLSKLENILWISLSKFYITSSAFFVLIGFFDIGIQRTLFLKKMKMSKDEIKREYKQEDGDPIIKGERRRLAKELAHSSTPAQRIALASVMIVNPTHYAIALRYEPNEHPLPRVIAKGVDETAAELRQEACKAGLAIIGNPPVARELYKVGINDPIPEALFEVVAAILRWLHAVGKDDPEINCRH